MLDRDEGENQRLTKLKDTLGSRCTITTLPVREIENYLVKPAPLIRYISSRISKTYHEESVLTIDAMSLAIEECVSKLRDFTLAKLLLSRVNAPAYVYAELSATKTLEQMMEDIKQSLCQGAEALRDRAKRIDDILQEVTSEVDGAWSTNKLKLVPRAELLDAIFKRFGIAYRKMRDARGIASTMEPSEVPAEIKTLLDQVIC